MHELSVTESILQIATRYGNDAAADKVTDIYLVIGSLASIIDDSVQFYWDIISVDTICAGAKLHFQRNPAGITCLNCGAKSNLEHELRLCPNCGSPQIRIDSGDEFYLDSIEIEKISE